jgi:vancomycin permeability regulator SanA
VQHGGFMGKIKAIIFIALGAIILLFMVPSVIAWELCPEGGYCIIIGVILILIPFSYKSAEKLLGKYFGIFTKILIVLAAIAVLYIIVVTILMINAMHDSNIPEDANVIVLGSSLLNGKPRHMLEYRLDVAAVYLKAHPKANCVVSGGNYGSANEGEVMKTYLVNKSIQSDRVFVENKAANTLQNIEFSKKFLGDNKNVVIATSDFHMLRSKYFAKLDGLNAYALCAKTPISNFLEAWVREYLALIKAFVFKC